jgi:hypothetical protein
MSTILDMSGLMPGSLPSLMSESMYLRSSSSRMMVVLFTVWALWSLSFLGSSDMLVFPLHTNYINRHILYVFAFIRLQQTVLPDEKLFFFYQARKKEQTYYKGGYAEKDDERI